MRASCAALVAIIIISASMSAAAEELSSTWPQNVRVNINVSEIAMVSVDEDIVLQPTAEPNIISGATIVRAEANFDYQITTQWLPFSGWDYQTDVSNTIDGQHDALYAATGPVSVEADLGATASDDPTPAPVAEAETSAIVRYDTTWCGIVVVTLSHAP